MSILGNYGEAEETAKAGTPAFSVSQQIIDEVLTSGGNEENSVQRIVSYFKKDHMTADNAAFLRDEYGRSGKGFIFGGNHVSVWFDKSGIRIARGGTVLTEAAASVTWEQSARRIRELLDMGRYAPQSELDKADGVELLAIADLIWDLHRDRAGGVEFDFVNPDLFRHGHPDDTARIAELLAKPEERAMILAGLEAFSAAYRQDNGLLRFPYSSRYLRAAIEMLSDLEREPLTFAADESVSAPRPAFITQDEVDQVLLRGGNVDRGKFRIYSYFTRNAAAAPKEKADFLKKEYGTGGNSRTGYNEWHDGKDAADNLQNAAEQAGKTANEANEAVIEAKNYLRQVRRAGRLKIQETKVKIKTDYARVTYYNGSALSESVIPGRSGTISRGGNSSFHTGNSGPGPREVSVPPNQSSSSRPASSASRDNGRRPASSTPRDINKPLSEPRARQASANAARSDMPRPKAIKTNCGATPKKPQAAKADITASENAARGDVPRPKASQISSGTTPKKPLAVKNNIPADAAPKRGLFHFYNVNGGAKSAKGADKTGKALKTGDKTVNSAKKGFSSAKKGFKETSKSTIKTAKKSVKTAEKTAKSTVKTAWQTAKSARKSAQTAAKTAKAAERAARAAAKTAVRTAKAAARAIAALVKAAIAAIKGLVALIMSGGWAAAAIILIICMIAMITGSVFGIFFSSEPGGDGGTSGGSGKTINGVITEINGEYTAQIGGIIAGNAHDMLDMSGARSGWKEILAVYTVRTVSDPDNPMEVVTMDDEKASILRAVFWDMNGVSYSSDTTENEADMLDKDGLPTGETTTVSNTVLRITVSHRTPEEMAIQYGFTDEQKAQLDELLKPEYDSLWNALLYGISSAGDGSMVEIAGTQIGNIGGKPFWSWYGFGERVEWCACFVSWCAGQCGYIDAGIMPKFSSCEAGIAWFKARAQWRDNGYTPAPGDLIFFDWGGDGVSEHVGIVERAEGGVVYTIEGNSSDSVARRCYAQDSVKIMGYGIPLY